MQLGGRAVLASTNLVVRPGESVALVGPSGAGKTTLLRVLAGLVPLSAGRVRLQGTDLAALTPGQLRAERAKVGFVHQDLALVPNLRASQNILAGALGRRGLWGGLRDLVWPRRADLERSHELLERVGIGELLFQRTDTLSGGERQRVAVARALFQNPVALLADEPVAAVDPVRAKDVVELLTGLAEERGLALVTSLHDIDLARAHFPRLVALRGGKLLFDGPPQDFDADRYRSVYTLEPGS